MAYSISVNTANIALDSALLPFANGVIEIRSGTRPVDPDAPASGVILSTIPLGATPFASAASRSSSLTVPVFDIAGDADGIATWFRMYDNSITANSINKLDGDVGAVASGADMILDDNFGGTSITITDKVSIDTMTVTL